MTRRRRRRRVRRTSTAVGGVTVLFICVVAVFLFQEAAGIDLGLELPTAVPAAQPVVETVGGGDNWYAVYFTDPQDPDVPETRVNGMDGVLVAAIQEARQSVDVAAYDIALQSVADALVTSSRNGVQVRVVTESDNMDREPLQQLLAAGIPVVDDQRSGLMHDKFIVIDGATVLTGSWNLTETGTWRNNNNVIQINSSRLAQNYTTEFEEMFERQEFGGSSPANTPYPELTINGVRVENYFSPDDGVAEQILQELRAARDSIYFMVFSFTREDFSEALIEQAAAGVTVRGLYETQQLASGSDQSWNLLTAAGLDVLEDGNRYKLHHKVFIIDGETVVLGSYNFSKSAEERNDENVLIIHDPDLAFQYLQEFAKLWLQAGGS